MGRVPWSITVACFKMPADGLIEVSPEIPVPQRISSADVIDVTSVTTEFNTLFETVVDIAAQVDPIKLNQTLTATAQALDGLGDRFGESIENGNQILTEINARGAITAREMDISREASSPIDSYRER